MAGQVLGHVAPVAWTTGDRGLDAWLQASSLESSVFNRLCMVQELADRHQIVQACRDNVSRIRCMGAFINGCISKSLKAQQYCKSNPELGTGTLGTESEWAS